MGQGKSSLPFFNAVDGHPKVPKLVAGRRGGGEEGKGNEK